MSFSPMKPYIHLTISTIDEERRFISGNVTVLQYNKKIILFSAASLKYSKMPIEPNQDSCYKKPFLKLQCSKVKCTLNGSTWRTSTLKITYASAHVGSIVRTKYLYRCVCLYRKTWEYDTSVKPTHVTFYLVFETEIKWMLPSELVAGIRSSYLSTHILKNTCIARIEIRRTPISSAYRFDIV